MPLRCKVFARLNNCANCDEADVSFFQTHKKKRKVSNICTNKLAQTSSFPSGFATTLPSGENLEVLDGDPLSYSCTASASISKSPAIYWTIDNEMVSSSSSSVPAAGNGNIVHTTSVLNAVALQSDCNKRLACLLSTNDDNSSDRLISSGVLKVTGI